jgi:hypothetical protein
MSGRLYLVMMVWAVLQALWPASPSASWWSSCGQWRLFVLRLLLFYLFFVASVLSMLEMQVYFSDWVLDVPEDRPFHKF